MRKIIVWPLALVLTFFGNLALANQEDQRDRNMQTLMLNSKAAELFQQAPSSGEGSSSITWAIIPEFHYSHHGDLKTNLGGVDLKSSSGTSKCGAITFTANKQITDVFNLGYIYEYEYTNYKGGLLTLDTPDFGGHSELNVTSHMTGILPTFDFKEYGRLETSLLVAWDFYSGNETEIFNGVPQTRSAASSKDYLTSMMAWYSLDFKAAENITVTPYVGWRSVYVVLSGQNDWSSQSALDTTHDSAWAHLAAGGVKLNYTSGLWSLSTRVGYNYRVSKSDIPGISARAVAPGVAHFGFMTSWDRSIANWGLGLSYVIPEKFIIEASYNGFVGSDTNAHIGSLAFVFPF